MNSSLSGLLLKHGVERGLTAYELSRLYIREELKQEAPSVIEKIVQQCVAKMKSLSPRERNLVRSNTVTEFPSPRDFTDVASESFTMVSTKPPSSKPLTRVLSTQSFSSLTYTSEPYRFPPVRIFKMNHE